MGKSGREAPARLTYLPLTRFPAPTREFPASCVLKFLKTGARRFRGRKPLKRTWRILGRERESLSYYRFNVYTIVEVEGHTDLRPDRGPPRFRSVTSLPAPPLGLRPRHSTISFRPFEPVISLEAL